MAALVGSLNIGGGRPIEKLVGTEAWPQSPPPAPPMAPPVAGWGEAPPPPPPPPAPPGRRRPDLTPGAIVAIIALVAATVGAGVWGFTRQARKRPDASTPIAADPQYNFPTTTFQPTDQAGHPLFPDPPVQPGFHVERDTSVGFSVLAPDGWTNISPSDVTVLSMMTWFSGPDIATLRFVHADGTKNDAMFVFVLNTPTVDGPVPPAVVDQVRQSLFARGGPSTVTDETIGDRPGVRIRGNLYAPRFGLLKAQIMMSTTAYRVVGVLVYSEAGGAPTTHDVVAGSLRVRR